MGGGRDLRHPRGLIRSGLGLARIPHPYLCRSQLVYVNVGVRLRARVRARASVLIRDTARDDVIMRDVVDSMVGARRLTNMFSMP